MTLTKLLLSMSTLWLNKIINTTIEKVATAIQCNLKVVRRRINVCHFVDDGDVVEASSSMRTALLTKFVNGLTTTNFQIMLQHSKTKTFDSNVM